MSPSPQLLDADDRRPRENGAEAGSPTPADPQGMPVDVQPEPEVDPAERDGSPVTASQRVSWVDKVEAFLSRLSTRDNFWHRVFSLLFLPLAFWSGIKMRRLDDETFAAIVPFKKFNKNWYNAMAGASLLANSEIAGGMYVFGEAGGDYTVVCKHLDYQFLRPCFGPAIYRMKPRENLKQLVAAGTEFNITLELDVRQQGFRPGERDKRVGRAEITFHVTPKTQFKVQKQKRKVREKDRARVRKANAATD